MTPKDNRLKYVKLNSPHSIRTKHFLIKYVFAEVNSPSKFACIISKKYLPLAVQRNNLRRRISRVVLSLLGNLRKPVNIIFILISKEEITDVDLLSEVSLAFEERGLAL